jgi:hypothetical protein
MYTILSFSFALNVNIWKWQVLELLKVMAKKTNIERREDSRGT